jgi:hypothetical protein
MVNEIYLGLIGGRAGRYWWGVGYWDAEGSPCGVGFDHKVVMDRQIEHGDIVGFFHTHPQMAARPSSIDYNTMGTWTNTFGKPLVCCIKGANGLKAHWFIDDETPHITGWVKQFGKIFIGRVPKLVRKKLRENNHG